MWKHQESDRIFHNWDQLRLWLVQTHNIARLETSEDLSDILSSVGVTIYVQPETMTSSKTPEEMQQELANFLQERLDTKAREHMYDDIKSLCTYLPDDPNPVYAAEGTLGRIWRSDTWTVSTAVMMQVMAGQRGIPTQEELLGLLMPLKWAGEV